jgi:B9 domain-containing protein 2
MAFTANTPQVHLIGEIRGATGFEAERLFCRYEFRVGHNWTLMGGKDSGETYEEIRDGVEEESVWDHPFDLHYKCKAIRGWPKLFVEVC